MTTVKKKVLLWGLSVGLIMMMSGAFVGYKMYTKPHRNVADAKAFGIPASRLVTEYETNETQANSKYLDKILEVNGEVAEVSKNQKGETVIALIGTDMGTVRCTVEGADADVAAKGAQVILKGICTGYLADVIMVRCVLQNK